MTDSRTALAPAARRYMTGVHVAAACAALACVALLARMEWTLSAAAIAALLGVAFVVMQVNPLRLVWRGERLAVHADEGVLMLGFLLIPAPLIILAATLATIVGQAWRRKPARKIAFNSAAQLVSTCAGALAYLAGVNAGMSALGAALLVPLAVSIVNQALVAMLLAILAGDGWVGAFRPALAPSVAIATTTGAGLGVIALALLQLHAAALVLLVPVWVILHRGMAWAYHRENELEARRILNQVATALLRHSDARAIVEEVTRGAKAAFAPLECGLTMGASASPPLASNRGNFRIAVPIRDGSAAPIGELWATFGPTAAADARQNEALLALLGGQLSLALVNARATTSLEASERRMRDAFDAAADPILVVDAQLRLVFENAASRRVIGGSRLDAALSRDSRARLVRQLEGRAPAVTVELELVGDGPVRLLEATTSTFFLPEGRSAFLIMTRDVTENRRLAAEAARQRVALDRAERLSSVGTLVEGVAHEINNPLMYVNASLDFAIMDFDDLAAALGAHAGALDGVDLASTKERLVAARAGADRIAQITSALGPIARGPGKRGRPVRLDALLGNLGSIVKAALPAGVRLDVSPVGGDGETLVAAELSQALVELTTNAVEAVQERGGTIRVGHRVEGAQVVLVVEDDGPGMSAEVQAKLFTPFFTTKVERTGLGLARAMSVATGLRGTIHVESEPGRGARFELRVPRESEAAAAAERVHRSEEPVGRHGSGRSFSIGRMRR